MVNLFKKIWKSRMVHICPALGIDANWCLVYSLKGNHSFYMLIAVLLLTIEPNSHLWALT